MKIVDLDETTAFLDHVCLGCTQPECKPNAKIIEQYNKMFESRISAGSTEKLPGWEKTSRKVAWSHDMEGHAQKCVEDIANWRTKRQNNPTKFQVLAWKIINSRRRSLKQLENYQKYAHKLS